MDTAVTTAFARSDKTVIFERSPLDVPPGFIQSKGLGNQETEIRNFVQAQVAKIITAKDLSEADALYNDMLKKAASMGLDKIDQAKDDTHETAKQGNGYTYDGYKRIKVMTSFR